LDNALPRTPGLAHGHGLPLVPKVPGPDIQRLVTPFILGLVVHSAAVTVG
jgi:hypothetical protein